MRGGENADAHKAGQLQPKAIHTFDDLANFPTKILSSKVCLAKRFIISHKAFWTQQSSPHELRSNYLLRDCHFQLFQCHKHCCKARIQCQLQPTTTINRATDSRAIVVGTHVQKALYLLFFLEQSHRRARRDLRAAALHPFRHRRGKRKPNQFCDLL